MARKKIDGKLIATVAVVAVLVHVAMTKMHPAAAAAK